MKVFFTAEDFESAKPNGMSEAGCILAAYIANKKLKEKGVRMVKHNNQWLETHDTVPYDTHTALLINIQPINTGERG